MGHGIAQVFAAGGHRVAIHDPDRGVLSVVPERVREICQILGQDPGAVARITLHSEFESAVADADVVIEAAPEKLLLKQQIFERLERTTPAHAILASNTSCLPISAIAARVKDAGRVLGTHFWNPPHLVELVEVVQAERTELAVVERMMALLAGLGWIPVHLRRDIPGFVGNRLQHALKREAIALVADGVCDAETVDLVVKHGFGARLAVLGPLEQSDLVGLNLTMDIHKTLLADLDRTPGPHPYLAARIAAGELGMATGRGFREWTPEQAVLVKQRLRDFLHDAARRRRESKLET